MKYTKLNLLGVLWVYFNHDNNRGTITTPLTQYLSDAHNEFQSVEPLVSPHNKIKKKINHLNVQRSLILY